MAHASPIDLARGPSSWDGGFALLPDWEAMAPPENQYVFYQEVHW